uniref:helix-turn-helix domain-containing protein n=1 Tax=Kitasatospora azatica TaxID=58347 RepID=UPI001E4FE581|nr:helix-turn-helix domain-containing protein [Kitasatospora azatica]
MRSVERWRRSWREGGEAGVLSKGSPGRPRLSEVQIVRLERELERGSLVHGWADQRWTLARINTLIGRADRFERILADSRLDCMAGLRCARVPPGPTGGLGGNGGNIR